MRCAGPGCRRSHGNLPYSIYSVDTRNKQEPFFLHHEIHVLWGSPGVTLARHASHREYAHSFALKDSTLLPLPTEAFEQKQGLASTTLFSMTPGLQTAIGAKKDTVSPLMATPYTPNRRLLLGEWRLRQSMHTCSVVRGLEILALFKARCHGGKVETSLFMVGNVVFQGVIDTLHVSCGNSFRQTKVRAATASEV